MAVEIKDKTSKRYELKKCPECGKEVQGSQGLWGHLCLAHGIKRLKRETRLAQELAELQATLGWKEQEWANKALVYEAEIQRLQQVCLMDEFLASKAERDESRWAQATCPYCGKSVGSHTEVTEKDTKRKGFMCPN